MSEKPVRNALGWETRARGACPCLAEPMETGDGLLARIVPTGLIPIDAFAALCAAARTHGNGQMEITARGSLQVRGLNETSAPRLASAVETLDFAFDEHVPVVANPLPTDPTARIRASGIASATRDAIAARAVCLAPKVSVVIDDGGPISFDTLAADIRLRAVDPGESSGLALSVGGDGDTATQLGVTTPHIAPTLVADLLAVLANYGPQARMRDVVEREGVEPFLRAAGDRIAPLKGCPTTRAMEAIGLHRLHDGSCAIGVALPFGQAQALDLIALSQIAGANGADWVALAPQRSLLLGPIGEMTAFALGTAADTLGFVVDARDARRRIAACAGAPACASGYIPARQLAAQIAERLPQGDFALHVSGCPKGCARPRPAPLTIVGTSHGADFICGGEVRHLSGDALSTDDLVARAVQQIVSESEDA